MKASWLGAGLVFLILSFLGLPSAFAANTLTIVGAASATAGSSYSVTVRANYNPGAHTVSISSNAQNSPNGTAPTPAVGGSIDLTGTFAFNSGSGFYESITSFTFTKAVSTAITVNDSTGGVTGNLTVPVNAGSANQLAFTQQPTDVNTLVAFSPSVAVAVWDSDGNVVTGSSASITLAISPSFNPGMGTLQGTTTVAASSGIATFNGVSVDQPGTGYKLQATSSGLPTKLSSLFNVTGSAVAVTIKKISPAFGPATGGNKITITGTGLTGITSMTVGTQSVALTDIKVVGKGGKSISVSNLPAGVGAAHVSISTAAGTNDTTDPASVYSYGPAITSISPNFFTSGKKVVIHGGNFKGLTSLNFGTSPVTFAASDINKAGTTISVTPPSGTGAVRVSATGPNGSNDTTSDATYFAFGPLVTKVNPPAGSSSGTGKVTITGKNFGASASALTVSFGSAVVPAANVSLKGSTLTVSAAPAQALGDPGVVNVVVTSATSGSSPLNAASEYAYAPLVTGVSPSSGSAGSKVKINGKNFTGASSVLFGGTTPITLSASDINKTATVITVTAPSGTAGTTTTVTVTGPGGTSDVNSKSIFTFK